MSATAAVMPAVSAREQAKRIVARWVRDLPPAEVQRRASALRAAILSDIALGAPPEDGNAALAVLAEAGL